MNLMFVAAFFIGFLLKVKKENVTALYDTGKNFSSPQKNKKFPEKKFWGIRFNKVVKLLI